MSTHTNIIICDLGFGDAGKGSIIDFLCRHFNTKLVVRYTGGSQAAHHIVTPENKHHCYSQFCSGALAGTKSHISADMLIEPYKLLCEAELLDKLGLANSLKTLTIDPQATIITPYHRLVGQLIELSLGENKYGSCGEGVGQTMYFREKGFSICFADFENVAFAKAKFKKIFEHALKLAYQIYQQNPLPQIKEKIDKYKKLCPLNETFKIYLNFFYKFYFNFFSTQEIIQNALAENQSIIFEGAQGALLDRYFGFYPYITKTRATFHNAQKQLEIHKSKYRKLGLFRAYAHIHGSGPLVTEDKNLAEIIQDQFNKTNEWQGVFRIGWLDLLTLRYSILINEGIDSLAITCLDQLSGLPLIKVCVSYLYIGDLTKLDSYFIWEKIDKQTAKIIGFKKPDLTTLIERKSELAEILKTCQPLDYLEFRCWKKPIDTVKNFSDLPIKVKIFLKFLASSNGLNIPIEIVSIGPNANEKIFI